MCSPLDNKNHAMAVYGMTAPLESPEALYTKVPPDNNTTTPPCQLLCTFCNVSGRKWSYHKPHYQYSRGYGPSYTKIPNVEKIVPENIPQQRKLANLDRIEEDFTGGYNNDGDLGPFFDANKEEGEHNFDEDSRPAS